MKIVNCRACKKKPILGSYGKGFAVYCSDIWCWCGPKRKTKSGAIKIWNKQMEVK